MKRLSSLIIITLFFLLSACSPHPASGVWKATTKNDYGIDKLVVAFDGKAHFTTTNQDTTKWHCFWTASGKAATDLKCTPSTNPDQKVAYTLTIDEQGIAQMKLDTQLIASFIRLDENPSPEN